jgi:hypothetical protein
MRTNYATERVTLYTGRERGCDKEDAFADGEGAINNQRERKRVLRRVKRRR